MSELILLRHGQASFGAASYDRLSEQGQAQIRRLRQHWQENGQRFDIIYSGTLLRQRQTAAELLPLLDSDSCAVIEDPALNEYDGDPLIQAYLRNHALAEGFPEDLAWPVREERLFQRLFEAATSRWIRDELDPHDDAPFESWQAFRERVHGFLDELMARHAGGARVLLSTSGGVIAMSLQRVLQFPDEQVISTNWMVHNSAISRIKYGGGRLSLSQFNAVPHLEHPDHQHMLSYR